MLLVVDDPRIEMKGDTIPEQVIEFFKKTFDHVELIDDSDLIDIDESDIFDNLEITPGDNLKIRRENKGMTQKELADLVGLKPQNISAYENGRRPIGYKMACKLSVALPGSSVEEFIHGN